MTLCIAWKDKEKVHFISDSRVSFKKGAPIDNAPKIVSLPVRIKYPRTEPTIEPTLVYNHDLGM